MRFHLPALDHGAMDRRAVHGVLAEIEALGLDLLEVRQLTPRPQITRIR
jgi:hypothetical protein